MLAQRYEFYVLEARTIHTRSLRSLGRYCSWHSKMKFISSHNRVIILLYIFHHFWNVPGPSNSSALYFLQHSMIIIWGNAIRKLLNIVCFISLASQLTRPVHQQVHNKLPHVRLIFFFIVIQFFISISISSQFIKFMVLFFD